MSEENSERLKFYIELVDNELEKYKSTAVYDSGEQRKTADAMWYSLSAGGKRIRPVLVMEFCRMCSGDHKAALDAAMAIEMIHTFSLIHDDLPCMDNDDFRRGKPSCHKAYGEVTALLAGDALESLAFEVIADSKYLTDTQKVKLIRVLSKNVGVGGMIGGQAVDTENEGKEIPEKLLLEMYRMKTGALLAAACEMGCICGGKDEMISSAKRYGEKLGLAFQIIDDILDIIGSQEKLGKPVGSDDRNNKFTYASLNGIPKAEEYASELTDDALRELDSFDDPTFLKELTRCLLKRDC
jgi:geranylgeranyl diphosphate synthase type II